jgi:hypothetical protein
MGQADYLNQSVVVVVFARCRCWIILPAEIYVRKRKEKSETNVLVIEGARPRMKDR